MNNSLTLARGYVSDAFKTFVTATFKPEEIGLGIYTFLPWVRTGLAAALEPPAAGQVRARVRISVKVQDEAGVSKDVQKTLTLRGPGDVIGLEPGQMVRRVPQPGTINAEESFLVHVEFDRPELPWLFTPLAPVNDRLQPWLVLVVCDASTTTLEPGPPGLPQRMRTKLGELYPLEDAWAFAHAQIVGPAAGANASVADRLSDKFGPTNLSRILCPRKLDPDRSYIAALVPSFDCGVKAGLGTGQGTLALAWTRAPNNSDAQVDIVLPVYDSWRFSTAAAGDFESMAKKLHGVVAPWSVGKRIVDASDPRGHLPALPAGAPGRTQVLKCALVSITPPPPDAPSESSVWSPEMRTKLRDEVDRPGLAADAPALPRVGPRLYARFQRGQSTTGAVFNDPSRNPDQDWYKQLNTSPMHRIVSGVGTRVVQRDQEPLMQAAWLQVGDIRKANEALVRIQFSRYVGESLYKQHLSKLPLGDLSQVMRGVQSKVRIGGGALTIYGSVKQSASAPAAMTGAFRRATRVRGPIARIAGPNAAVGLSRLVATGTTFNDLRRTYTEPDGIKALSPGALEGLSIDVIASTLKVKAAVAKQTLSTLLATTAAAPTGTDRVMSPTGSWSIPAGSIDLGEIAATKIGSIVDGALPDRLTDDAVRVETLAPLLVGIANSGIPKLAKFATDRIHAVDKKVPLSPIAGGPAGAERSPLERRETGASRMITQFVTSARQVAFKDAALGLSQLGVDTGVMALPVTPGRQVLSMTRESLLGAIAPGVTVTAYAKSQLARLPSWLASDWFDDLRVKPIMAAPRFERPMYEALDAYDRDWLIPGIGAIPFTDFVTVLFTNPAFTEAFLTGLSDEMGRELLWRGYPTDQRGTYFWRFWRPEADELTGPIHAFNKSPLGSHIVGGGGDLGNAVLVVRGELARRYPDLIALALRAGKIENGKPVFIDPDSDATAMAKVLFHDHLEPDILLVGFDLTAAKLLDPNERWWFILAEHPTAPRFGLDLMKPGNAAIAAQPPPSRNVLDWNDLGPLAQGRFLSPRMRTLTTNDPSDNPAAVPPQVTWPGTASVVARTLLQNPIRAAFDARKLLSPALGK